MAAMRFLSTVDRRLVLVLLLVALAAAAIVAATGGGAAHDLGASMVEYALL
jgi:hypothetical protein